MLDIIQEEWASISHLLLGMCFTMRLGDDPQRFLKMLGKTLQISGRGVITDRDKWKKSSKELQRPAAFVNL